jgi:isopenicillin N synthase-like dioxygenase
VADLVPNADEYGQFAHVEMMAKSPTLPGAFWDNAELIERFMGQCDTICQTVLSCLSDALQLEGAARFEESHRASDPTKTMLSLQHYRKGAGGHNKHTDISSLVVLFTRLPGLQVVMPETGAWTYVQPRPGHAIINVGDALRFLSGRRLYSCLHRVLPVNGDREKDSVVYSRRPTDSVKVEDTEGNVVTVKAWHDNKYSMFVKANEVQDTSKISTGGMTEVLQVA